jgi:hypothetical protein
MVVFVHACAIHVPNKPLKYAGKGYITDTQFHALDGKSMKLPLTLQNFHFLQSESENKTFE